MFPVLHFVIRSGRLIAYLELVTNLKDVTMEHKEAICLPGFILTRDIDSQFWIFLSLLSLLTNSLAVVVKLLCLLFCSALFPWASHYTSDDL